MFSGLICMRPSNFLDHDGVGRMAHGPLYAPHKGVHGWGLRLLGELCKYGFDSLGKVGIPMPLPLKQTNEPFFNPWLAPSPLRKKVRPPVFSGLICMRPSNFLDHDGVGRMAHGPSAGVHSIHLGNFFVHLGNFVSFTSLDRARST